MILKEPSKTERHVLNKNRLILKLKLRPRQINIKQKSLNRKISLAQIMYLIRGLMCQNLVIHPNLDYNEMHRI